MDNERMLVRCALKGDIGAFESLVRMYQDKLFSFLLKMALSRQDAEEMLQEVFIRAYKYLYQYNEQWQFSTWIYKVAINVYKSEMKRKKKMHAMISDADITLLPGAESDNPEIAFSVKERHKEVMKLINSLKDKQKIPLVLKYVKGFSYKEIARIIGGSEEAAKMKVMRAKEKICEMYFENHRSDGL